MDRNTPIHTQVAANWFRVKVIPMCKWCRISSKHTYLAEDKFIRWSKNRMFRQKSRKVLPAWRGWAPQPSFPMRWRCAGQRPAHRQAVLERTVLRDECVLDFLQTWFPSLPEDYQKIWLNTWHTKIFGIDLYYCFELNKCRDSFVGRLLKLFGNISPIGGCICGSALNECIWRDIWDIAETVFTIMSQNVRVFLIWHRHAVLISIEKSRGRVRVVILKRSR